MPAKKTTTKTAVKPAAKTKTTTAKKRGVATDKTAKTKTKSKSKPVLDFNKPIPQPTLDAMPAEWDGKRVYVVGEMPYLYAAVASDSLNLTLYRYRDDGGTPGWLSLRKYACDLGGAMVVFARDADKLRPTKRAAKTRVMAGFDAVIKEIDAMKRALSRVATREGVTNAASGDE